MVQWTIPPGRTTREIRLPPVDDERVWSVVAAWSARHRVNVLNPRSDGTPFLLHTDRYAGQGDLQVRPSPGAMVGVLAYTHGERLIFEVLLRTEAGSTSVQAQGYYLSNGWGHTPEKTKEYPLGNTLFGIAGTGSKLLSDLEASLLAAFPPAAPPGPTAAPLPSDETSVPPSG